MIPVDRILDVAVALTPVLLGYIARVARRIDARTEAVEAHDRTLYGDDATGYPGLVSLVDADGARTDGGRDD